MILRQYSFLVNRMESEGILQYDSNYMKKKNISLLSQFLAKVSTKLDSVRKVNHADILLKLDQKDFLTEIFNQRLIFLMMMMMMMMNCFRGMVDRRKAFSLV